LLGTTFKLNLFNVFVVTIHRWFDITAAETELKYSPIIPFDEGFEDCIEWFKQNWLPNFKKQRNKGLMGISAGSQKKIDIQNQHTGKAEGKKSK
jgi:hypothetical protein